MTEKQRLKSKMLLDKRKIVKSKNKIKELKDFEYKDRLTEEQRKGTSFIPRDIPESILFKGE